MHILKNTTKYKTYIMTKNLIYIFLLCSVFCIYGCSSNEEKTPLLICTEPNPEPFDLENTTGVLEYDNDQNYWVFRPDSVSYFISTTTNNRLIIAIENMNKEYENLAGRVRLDGTFEFKHSQVYYSESQNNGHPYFNIYFSLTIKNISKETTSEK